MGRKIKLFYMLLLVMTILFSTASLWGSSGSSNWGDLIVHAARILLMTLGVPILIRLGRKIGIEISQEAAEQVMSILVNIIATVEQSHQGKDGATKKQIALGLAENGLTNQQKQLMIQKHGSLEAAVEVAFQRSHLANKRKEK